MGYFTFRHQPLKALHCVYVVFSLPIWVPFRFAISAVPAWRPRRTWLLKRAVMVHAPKLVVASMDVTSPLPFVSTARQRRDPDRVGFVWVNGVPGKYAAGEIAEAAKVDKVALAVVPSFWHGRRDRARTGIPQLDHRSGSGAPDGAGGASNTVSGILAQSGSAFARAFALGFRVSAAAPFSGATLYPAALLCALAGYRSLTGLGSARPGPLPLLSPPADWGCTHDADAPRTSSIRSRRAGSPPACCWCAYLSPASHPPRCTSREAIE